LLEEDSISSTMSVTESLLPHHGCEKTPVPSSAQSSFKSSDSEGFLVGQPTVYSRIMKRVTGLSTIKKVLLGAAVVLLIMSAAHKLVGRGHGHRAIGCRPWRIEDAAVRAERSLGRSNAS